MPYKCPEKRRESSLARTRKWRASLTPDKKRSLREANLTPQKTREWNLKTKYGLTTKQWNEKFIAQGSCCAICKSPDAGNKRNLWHTDHCHSSEEIRDILCQSCNHMIGNAKDDAKRLLEGYFYILKHQGKIDVIVSAA